MPLYHTNSIYEMPSTKLPMSSKTKPNPLPLENTLRDLALLRASDIDLSSVLAPSASPAIEGTPDHGDIEASIDRSYQFVGEARNAIRIQSKCDIEKQGERIEGLRNKLEDVVDGLKGNS